MNDKALSWIAAERRKYDNVDSDLARGRLLALTVAENFNKARALSPVWTVLYRLSRLPTSVPEYQCSLSVIASALEVFGD